MSETPSSDDPLDAEETVDSRQNRFVVACLAEEHNIHKIRAGLLRISKEAYTDLPASFQTNSSNIGWLLHRPTR